jgi:branched-chain amino acid transport system permease protein
MSNLQILIQAPIFSVQLLIDGLLVGAIFALVAYGMALVWGVMNIINVAQGELVMLGGYVTLILYQAGVSPFLGIPTAAIVLYLIGLLLYYLVIWRIVERDLFVSLLATFGLSILIQQLANQVFGANVETARSDLGTLLLFGGSITVSEIKLVAFVGAFIVAGIMVVFLKYSRLGQAIRATAQDARAARILGVDTQRVYATTFALNAAICGAAGALVAMTWIIHPYLGLAYTVRSFMIVVVAGLGNLAGVIVAGLGLGVAETFAGFLLGAEAQAAFVFSLLVIILVFRSLLLHRQRKVLR